MPAPREIPARRARRVLTALLAGQGIAGAPLAHASPASPAISGNPMSPVNAANPASLVASPGAAASQPAAGPAAPASASPTSAPMAGRSAPSSLRLSERDPVRRWAIGIEGVALQIPPLRPRVASLDARYLGNSVTTGGVGALARVRVRPELALELAVRSGSLRYRSRADLLSQDLLLAELGALLFLARGDIGHFALDAGVGGLGHRIRYELAGGRTGAQLVGAFTVRVGADLELLLRRVALTFSLRAYGVVTDLARTRASGEIFADASPALRQAPLPRYQTYLLGSVGLLYRF